jgi:hypothetical protein
MKMMISHFSSHLLRAAKRGTFVLTLFLLAALGAHPAFAQGTGTGTTLGDVVCNVATNIYTGPGWSIADLISGIAYIAGAILIGYGLTGLKDSAQDSSKTPVYQAIARLVGGAALLSLPGMTAWLIQTFFGFSGGDGLVGCGDIYQPQGGDNISLDQLLINLVYNIKDPFTWMMSIGAFTFGVFLIFRGLVKAAKYGTDPKAYSIPNILIHLVVGTLLITVGQSLGMILFTLFGTDTINPSSDVYSWNFIQQLNASEQFTTALIAALTFFQLIGIIAFIRGWIIIKNAVEGNGQATMAQGFTHVIGGVCAINIYGFLEIIDSTFGTGML